MRKLFIMRGAPASGKSTFLKEKGYAPYSVNFDDIRNMIFSPEIKLDSNHNVVKTTSQQSFKLIKNIADTILENKMQKGQTIFYDKTNTLLRDVSAVAKLAKKYGYRITTLSFTTEGPFGLNALTLSDLIKRDNNRPEIKRVGEKVIKKFYNRMQDRETNRRFTKKYNMVEATNASNELNWNVEKNNDRYDKIKVIGDIHSSAAPLKKALGEYDERTLYVFLGDYFDRGIEPVETFKILLQYLDKPNAIFIEGNHEAHIRSFVEGNEIKNRDFKTETLPALLKAGYTKKDLKKLLNKLQPVFLFKPDDNNINTLLFTHAGLNRSQIQQDFILMNDDFFIKGLGGYTYNIDKDFDNDKKLYNNKNVMYQFHGHRNEFKVPVIHDKQRSFNLEQKVEFGGKLGVVNITLTHDEHVIKVEDKSVINTNSNYDENSDSRINKLMKNNNINVKKLNDNLFALNFNEKVFKNKIWNSETTKARGLFVDRKYHVVARGYDKFFNINERPETELNKIIASLKNYDKIEFREKWNGYLTIVSYLPDKDDLLITSKGGGLFHSELAKQTLEDTLKENGHSLNELKEYLKDLYNKGIKISLTFETISNKDVHLIKHTQNKSIFLDIIDNSLDTNYHYKDKLYFDLIKQFDFNEALTMKIIDTKDIDYKDFAKLIDDIDNRKDIEGSVINFYKDDKIVNKVKIKTKYYKARKELRNNLQHIIKLVKDNKLDKVFEIINVKKYRNENVKTALLKIYNNDKFKNVNYENVTVKDNNDNIYYNKFLNIPKIIDNYDLDI